MSIENLFRRFFKVRQDLNVYRKRVWPFFKVR